MTTEEIRYPEHEKLHSVVDKSQACGAFVEWLSDVKHIHLCIAHEHDDQCYEGGRSPRCGIRNGEFLLSTQSLQDLLAERFDIDLKKLEAEKRQMLEDLRHAHD